MENATKALLIAAAILIAIILISMGIAVVRQGQEAVQSVDMSDMEIQAFNSKFTKFEKENISTSEANTLLKTVFSHNQTEEQKVSVLIFENLNRTKAPIEQKVDAEEPEKLTGQARYKVEIVSKKNGLVNMIHILKRGS